jgi:hypothetical protein
MLEWMSDDEARFGRRAGRIVSASVTAYEAAPARCQRALTFGVANGSRCPDATHTHLGPFWT